MELCVVWQDVHDIEADLVVLKVIDVDPDQSGRFLGASLAVAKSLISAEVCQWNVVRQTLEEQGYCAVDPGRAMAAGTVRFSLTGPPPFRYASVFRFARRITSAVDPTHRHLATTLHGPGLGLRQEAAFAVQIDGLLSGLSAGEVERVSIVERDHEVATKMRGWLLARFADAERIPDGVRLTTLPRGVRHPREWAAGANLDSADARFFSAL
ncbi:MAG: hypothetical protein ACI8RZ_000932 [Myxococcota bacterium]|jgi:hypothetical protein